MSINRAICRRRKFAISSDENGFSKVTSRVDNFFFLGFVSEVGGNDKSLGGHKMFRVFGVCQVGNSLWTPNYKKCPQPSKQATKTF